MKHSVREVENFIWKCIDMYCDRASDFETIKENDVYINDVKEFLSK